MTAKTAPRETVAPAVRGAKPSSPGPVTPVRGRGGRRCPLCVWAYDKDVVVRVISHPRCAVPGHTVPGQSHWRLVGLPPWWPKQVA